jgi:ABC-type phosphate/phosphonate transport system substrate-binding protein
MIANARMYSVSAEVAALWGRLLKSVGAQARMELEIATHAAPAPLAELWQREDKAAVFMCGLPFSSGSFAAQVLAAPVPSPAAFQGQPRYWSELVVRRDSHYRNLADTFGHRMAFTVADSQSGFAAPLHHLSGIEGPFPRFAEIVAPRITPLGALNAVIEGSADIAPVDSYAFALLDKYRPELTAQVRSVAQTEPTPIPPLISSPGALPPGACRVLQAAFLDAHTQRELQPIMRSLLLERFVLPDAAAYDPLRTTFERSKGYWRDHVLASVVRPAFL